MVILLTMTIVNIMVMQHCIGEVEIDLSWWRHIFHFSQKGTVVVMAQIYLWEFLRKFLRKKERKVTVMLSMVEMPKVIFSPDSAGMRKTNLGDIFSQHLSTVFEFSRPIVRVC